MRLNKIILFLVIIFFSCDDSSEYDVIIVGGGVGGTSAAIESSRNGAKTLLIEETDWLGGMLTNWGTISNSIKKLNKIPGIIRKIENCIVLFVIYKKIIIQIHY